MKKTVLILLMVTVLLSGLSITARAGSQDFLLVNQTGVDLYGVYISPTNSNSWEENVLGGKILYDGTSIRITFSNYSQTYWDLMIKDRLGNSLYWRRINLKAINKIILYYNGSQVVADFI